MKKNDKHRTISQHSQLIHKRDILYALSTKARINSYWDTRVYRSHCTAHP